MLWACFSNKEFIACARLPFCATLMWSLPQVWEKSYVGGAAGGGWWMSICYAGPKGSHDAS